MGLGISKPLTELTKEDLAVLLERLGPRFAQYAQVVRENAVDGELLCSLNEVEFAETLEDLHVSRLHQKVLTKEWKALQRKVEACTNDVPRDIIISLDDETSTWSKEKTKELLAEHPEWTVELVDIQLSDQVQRKIFDALSAYDLSEYTSSNELEGFERIAIKAMNQCNALYAGVHLIDQDGHVSLSSRAHFGGDRELPASTERLHAPKEVSMCHAAILSGDGDFIVKTIGKGRSPFNFSDRESKYVGFVTKNKDGLPIGILCAFIDGDDDVDDRKAAIMKELAAEVEQQLELRRLLLERNQNLRRQIEHSKSQSDIVLPAFGPVKEVSKLDIDRREKSPFPTPDEIKATGKHPRTAMLPMFHNENSANAQEREHLPEDYYATLDTMGADRTPINKNDMERVAAVEAFGLKDIPYDDPTGVALKRLSVSCMPRPSLLPRRNDDLTSALC
jgi:hypothetical protein